MLSCFIHTLDASQITWFFWGCLHHGPWSRPIELVLSSLWYTSREIKMEEWPWKLMSPEGLFPGLHYPLSWSNMFCTGRGKRGSLTANVKRPWQRIPVLTFNFLYHFFFSLSRHFHSYEERKRKKKGKKVTCEGKPQNYPFFNIYLENQRIHFLVHNHFSLVHVWFTTSQRPKDF